jgi:hypothetical protein
LRITHDLPARTRGAQQDGRSGYFPVILASPSHSAPKRHNEVVLESALGSVLHSKFQPQSTDREVMLESLKHPPDKAELAWGGLDI